VQNKGNDSVAQERRIAIIACGVLEWNIDRIAARLTGVELIKRILPAQLHQNPRKLRTMVQQEIDALDAGDSVDGVVLGFGVCGRGTIGISARRASVIVPRTQDCIGISLGSHERYVEEFSQRPGTKYMTQGWYDTTVTPRNRPDFHTDRDRSLYGPQFEEFERHYGTENARFICEFRTSWKRNYQRAAYIRFPGEEKEPPGRVLTSATARSLQWEDEVLDGDESLLEAMLSGTWEDPRLLVVPPHCTTVSAPGGAVIAFATGTGSHVDEALSRYRRSSRPEPVRRTGIGLGIDTGGTFTDAVIYDFSAERVLAWAKAATTHGDLIRGIRNVLADVPDELIREVERVGISTTLATNAFVEAKGRPVGVMLLSPTQIDCEEFPFRFVRQIAGTMNMNGEEASPIDPAEVAEFAREAAAAGCEAFAVSGFAGVINPAHELAVAEIALAETGLHAVCGHQLTSHLNFVERATTAAMNAKLVPLIEHLLDAIRDALAERGLGDVRIMVVKGDGSQMLDAVARDLPVETLLSGPAASVVGGAALFDCPHAVVVDMGGTTLDVALFRDHAPVRSEEGARIGDFRTSVRAMAVQTIGLGGDSEINLCDWPRVRIGPRRIVPVSRMAQQFPETRKTLNGLSEAFVPREPNCLDFVTRVDGATSGDGLLSHVDGQPILLSELARRVNRPGTRFIKWRDLETEGSIQRYGLTLTDILHVQNSFAAFDRDAAACVLDCWAGILATDAQQIIEAIHHEFRRMVCNEILGVALPTACPWDEAGDFRHWLTRQLASAESVGGARFRAELDFPVIAVGAPTPVLFPQLADALDQDILISEYAAVANALGAVAGDVLLQQSATVRVMDDGALLCSWRGGTTRCPGIREALTECEQALRRIMAHDAEANAIPAREPHFSAVEHQGETRDGPVLLGVTLTAELRG